MLLLGVVLGLIAGIAAGGRFDTLLKVRIRWPVVILAALVLRFGTEWAISNGIAIADALRLPLLGLSFGLLVAALWVNRGLPGLLVAALGVASNGAAIVANGGWMPVWGPSLGIAGLSQADLEASFHRLLPDPLDLTFLFRAGPLGDIIPFPVPFLANVASVGDVFLAVGLGWFIFSTLVRGVPPADAAGAGGVSAVSVVEGAGLERPLVLGGGGGPGALAGSAAYVIAQAERAAAQVLAPLRIGLRERARGHAYMRLALDARFSAFWIGQTISLIGDRLHQVALGVMVYAATDSPLATGLVFLAATLPNLLLGPIAGTFVDRWDHKRVMVSSDLIRGALVLAVPFAVTQNVALAYPLVFAITTVSLFFRPAKAAVVPRIVHPDDLLAANSATWTGETVADVVGFPLAGLFVAFLGSALPIAFFADAATYLASGLLILAITIPPVVRDTTVRVGGALRTFSGELMEGWRFLRSQPALYQNTLISAIAQTAVGVTLALTVVYARDALDGSLIPYPQNYAAIETAIGLGNLVGGFAVGAIGARYRKGRLIVGGMIVMGLSTVLLGLTANVALALIAAGVLGIANLVYIIPTQTLFGELVPPQLMGRVIALRASLVFGAMTGAMGVAGIVAESVPVGLVLAASGVLTAAAGLLGALLPAVRDPDGPRANTTAPARPPARL